MFYRSKQVAIRAIKYGADPRPRRRISSSRVSPFRQRKSIHGMDFSGPRFCGRRLSAPVPSGPPESVLYPRASALGGCTAHNAMIFIYPQDTDWEQIARLTNDPSWSARNMRRYFQRIENCRHRPLWRFLSRLTRGHFNPTGHGWKGWLETGVPLPRKKTFGDRALMRTINETIRSDLQSTGEDKPAAWRRRLGRTFLRLARFTIGESDPSDQLLQGELAEGLCEIPLSTFQGRRRGTRERVLTTIREHGLEVQFDTLATRFLLDADKRAVGVEFLKG
jgi:choline dehydrogenase